MKGAGIYLFQIVGMLCFGLWFKFCHTPVPKVDTVVKEKVIIYDSTKRTVTVPTPPVSVKIFTVPIPAGPIDTLAILRKYFAVHTYSQTIRDGYIEATVFDTVSQNRILGRGFTYKLIQPIKTIESTTVTLPPVNKSGLYMGALADYTHGRMDFGICLSFQTKKNLVIGYQYAAMQRGHRVTLQQKLKW